MKNATPNFHTPFGVSVTALLCSFLVWQSTASGSQLQPFSSYIKDRPEWYKDDSEVAYVSTRCGALLMAIGMIYESGTSTQIDKNKGLEIKNNGIHLIKLGNIMSEKVGLSQQNFENRVSLIINSYGETIKNNRALHNNMFHGFMLSDFEFCSSFQNVARSIAR